MKKNFKIFNICYIRPVVFFWGHGKHHTDTKCCSMYNLMKSEFSDVMYSEGNLSVIYTFFAISFALIFLVSSSIFSCV
jgi:hypothetical protein